MSNNVQDIFENCLQTKKRILECLKDNLLKTKNNLEYEIKIYQNNNLEFFKYQVRKAQRTLEKINKDLKTLEEQETNNI